MPNCLKCGAELIGSRKFCAACGAPAESRPGPRSAAAASIPPVQPPPDPYAETAMKPTGTASAYGPPPPPMQQQGYAPPRDAAAAYPQSPLASSNMAPMTPEPSPPQPAYAPPPQQQAAYAPPPPPQPAYAPPPQQYVSPYAAVPPPQQQQYGNYAPPPPAAYPNYAQPPAAPYGAPPPPPSFGPGARVLVQWADGNRYPATVQQAANGQCLIVFPNGQQQWVEMRFLSAGM